MGNSLPSRLLRVSADELSVETEAGRAPCIVAAQTLRHACVCDSCVDAYSGQKRLNVDLWPSELTIASAEIRAGAELVVGFKEDPHLAVVRMGDIAGETPATASVDRRSLWDATLKVDSVLVSWPRLDNPAERFSLLDHLTRYGFAIVDECPAEPGFIPLLAPYIGRIKESRAGPVFDIKFDPSPTNLAFSADDLFLHTDNPYRDPVPGWQILHCISNAGLGGESYVVDGFACAAHLRDRYPDEYEALTSTIVSFGFASRDASFAAGRPIIASSEHGFPVQVTFNDRSMWPVYGPSERVTRFYKSYRRYRSLLADPAHQVRFKLKPGQAFIVDNYRVLHARAAFSAMSQRYLQGAYLDRDWVSSNFRVAFDNLAGNQRHAA